MSRQIDEDEHSSEMQLPYLARVFRHRLDEVAFVPVLVGSLDGDALDIYRLKFLLYLKFNPFLKQRHFRRVPKTR